MVDWNQDTGFGVCVDRRMWDCDWPEGATSEYKATLIAGIGREMTGDEYAALLAKCAPLLQPQPEAQ